MRYFILIFLFSVQAFAWEITFDRTNHAGIRKIDILKHENGVYIFDGKDIGKTLPTSTLNSWRTFEKGPTISAKSARCASGTYTFEKKDKIKSFKREGCTEGDSYGRMIKNLEEIRTYANGI
ncbi:hypothetical protein [Bdellovibrio svalbardensis]|uniref:Uncharacterized protein n=1 Tax=Bdellovibrio svalbardensis TaxID=2972972 RepID=A0ABT6DIZ1_9BACT|nr:hypothetical protein [Bdellovibrio svalbardensis]MDG0816795.1 hypothetical protein [Bdellovibrio svalbardensis]